jgi:hypothetical protein
MRFQLRTIMVFILLLAIGFAAPNPVLALTLIFTCPLWLVLIAYKQRKKPAQSCAADEP